MSATFTSEIREEFEQERERWLRRRLLWYFGVIAVFSALTVVPLIVGFLWAVSARRIDAGTLPAAMVGMVAAGGSLALVVWAFFHVRRRLLTREAMIRFVFWIFVVNGVMQIVSNVLSYELLPPVEASSRASEPAPPTPEKSAPPETAPSDAPASVVVAPPSVSEQSPDVQVSADGAPPGATPPDVGAARERVRFSTRQVTRTTIAFGSLLSFLVAHVFMCLFLPLTPRESLRPLVPVLAINVLFTALYWPGLAWFLLGLGTALVIGMPGAAICSWRQGRFHERFHMKALKRRYGEMRQELTDARRIHEALFPQATFDGPVHMDYRYEPMRQIGGDYLYSRFTPSENGPLPALNVVIVDVTGHGIPAALTVNRLHGELERLYAENPGAAPGFILTMLNRYVHLTLATHSVYVTAVCFRADPNRPSGDTRGVGALEWASGGHPPAFLRCVDGTLHRLDSTTFVLGACHGDDFQHHQQSIPFGPGDVVIAYTDGATEARDRTGRMLRIDGLQRIVAGISPEDGSLAAATLREVERFRYGPPADDTLVVEIARPVS